MSEPRKRIDTAIGSVAVVPECKVQATCTNGSKCWEAGECLRAPCEANGYRGARYERSRMAERDPLATYEREVVERAAIEARQFGCAVRPLEGQADKAFRAAMTNDIIVALARHDLRRVAALALGAEMSLAHRAHRERRA